MDTPRTVMQHVDRWLYLDGKRQDVTYPLAFFRISLGLICLGKVAVLLGNWEAFYGQYGLIQWTITKVELFPFLPHIGDLVLWLVPYGWTTDQATLLFLTVYCLTSALLVVGLFTRVMSIFLFVLHLTLIDTGGGIIYGVDVFTQLALFYGMFFPLNSWFSLDNAWGLRKPVRQSAAAGRARRAIQLQLCIVYLSTGIEKSLGEQWWNGEAIWRTFMMPIFQHLDFSWLAYVPVLPMVVGWSVLVIETAYAVVVWIPRWRVGQVMSIVLLHAGIGLLMGMWFFALIMITLSVFAFGHEVRQDLLTSKWFLTRNALEKGSFTPSVVQEKVSNS